jgi:D-alanine-D-alanine ligase-like ATP-grasp enzyme
MNNKKKDEIILVVVTNVDDDDFSILFDNLKYGENILVLCDKGSAEGYNGKIKFIVDDFKDYKDYKNIIKKIKDWEFENKKRISGIIGLDEEYHYNISYYVSKELSLEFYEKKVLDICSNKYLQRKILNDANINVPNFELVNINNPVTKIPFPNVTKVVTGYASIHVYLNKNIDDFNKAIELIKESSKEESIIFSEHKFKINNKNEIINPKQQIIVEEFVKGVEYSCDYMINNNEVSIIRVARKITKDNDFSFFHGFYLFNPLFETHMNLGFKYEDILNTCKNCANAINIKKGICMMDFIVSENKIYVIETTIRPGISTFTDLISKIYPYTSLDLLIQQKIGLKRDYIIPNKTGLIMYITSKKSGIIRRFNTEKISNMPNILKICKYYKENEIIEKDGDLPKLMGYILISNVNFNEINKLMLEINKNINLEIE